MAENSTIETMKECGCIHVIAGPMFSGLFLIFINKCLIQLQKIKITFNVCIQYMPLGEPLSFRTSMLVFRDTNFSNCRMRVSFSLLFKLIHVGGLFHFLAFLFPNETVSNFIRKCFPPVNESNNGKQRFCFFLICHCTHVYITHGK